jgi:peptide/nickel transport system permease protein
MARYDATRGLSAGMLVLGRRIAFAVPSILIVIVLGFAAVRLAPGDPVMLLAGEQASQEYIMEVRERYGLDQPLYVQFARYSAALAQGDLGYSYANKQSVLDLILERLPATLLLVSAALSMALLFGLALALLAVRFLNTTLDRLISALSMLGYSVPVFWLAQLLIYIFAVELDLFPASGMTNLRTPSEGFEHAVDVLYHLVLPATNLGLIYVGLISRLARAEMAEISTMDFIMTARAKGLTENRILIQHVLRNALAPVVTISGVIIGMAFAGAIFTETIFAWPGLGRLLYDALFARDYPVVTGMFLFISVALVLTNIAVDLIYAIVDPRVREQ